MSVKVAANIEKRNPLIVSASRLYHLFGIQAAFEVILRSRSTCPRSPGKKELDRLNETALQIQNQCAASGQAIGSVNAQNCKLSLKPPSLRSEFKQFDRPAAESLCQTQAVPLQFTRREFISVHCEFHLPAKVQLTSANTNKT